MTLKPHARRFLAFLGLNFCLSLLVGSFYLFFAGRHPLELLFVCLALVSNTVMLYIVLGGLSSLLFLLPRGIWAAGALLGAFQLALVTDAGVYKIFKFHLNSMVLNLVLTPGGLDSLEQGWGMKVFYLLLAAGVFLLQWVFWTQAGRLAHKLEGGRRLKLLAAALLLAVAADKGLFAWGTLYDSVYITRNAQLFPLYQPLRIRSFAAKYLGVKLDKEVAAVDMAYSALAYPAGPLRVEKPARPLNLVIIAIDSLRADMFTPEIMPETWAFSKKAAVFRNHYSGGNCTRFGIFSVFYGIYGNYWFSMLGERRQPALMDALEAQGYDMRLFASTKLSFPEFNKTCFANVPRGGIYDEPPAADVADRDADIAARLAGYIKERKKGRPYFAFLFYDASHGAYSYPPGFDHFKPAVDTNRLALNKQNIGPLFNKYKNSVRYDDHLTGGILKAIESTGGLKDTVVLVLGDHGEAFLERGRYGHNQGYSPEEVRVPLVLYLPGRAPAAVDGLTSHLDIAATLLPLFGVKNPVSDYSSGRDLFSGSAREYVPSFSWDSAAIIRNGGTLVMPLEAYKGGVKAYDSEYRELGRGAAQAYMPLVAGFQKEARRFSR